MSDRVTFHRCAADSLDLNVRADFILTFYMLHESPSPSALLDRICTLLAPGGIYYLAEPAFHVSTQQFRDVLAHCTAHELSVIRKGGIFSRTAVMRKSK